MNDNGLKKTEIGFALAAWGRMLFILVLSVMYIPCAIKANTYYGEEAYMDLFTNPLFWLCYLICMGFMLALLIFAIVDMVKVSKQGINIVGLVLFYFLMKPGYLLWRNHLLKGKKLLAILTLIFYILFFLVLALLMGIFVIELMKSVM